MIRAGRLRNVLTVQERSSSGGDPGDWSDLSSNATMRCELIAVKADEASDNPTHEIRWKARARYRSDITAANRLVDSAAGRYFEIEGKIPVNNREHEMLLELVERNQ